MLDQEIFAQLDFIAQMIPAPVYWLDTKGRFIGLNQKTIEVLNAPNKEFIINKTVNDLYPKDIAEKLSVNINMVLTNGKECISEDTITEVTSKKIKYFLAIKTPLFNKNNKLIGLIGTSMEITAQKEAEMLKIENAKHSALLQAQEMYKEVLNNIANTIYKVQMSFVNQQEIGINKYAYLEKKNIKLTKREREILFLMSLNKNHKEIANIISNREGKALAPATVSSVICKSLYIKFEAFSPSELIERVKALNLMPFLPDSFLIPEQLQKK